VIDEVEMLELSRPSELVVLLLKEVSPPLIDAVSEIVEWTTSHHLEYDGLDLLALNDSGERFEEECVLALQKEHSAIDFAILLLTDLFESSLCRSVIA